MSRNSMTHLLHSVMQVVSIALPSSIHFLDLRIGLSVSGNHPVVVAQVLQINSDFKNRYHLNEGTRI